MDPENKSPNREEELQQILKQFDREERISISALQIKLSIGFITARNLLNELLKKGLITPVDDRCYRKTKE